MATTSKQLAAALRRREVIAAHNKLYPQAENSLAAIHSSIIEELEQRQINSLLERLIQEKVVAALGEVDINVIVDGEKISSAIANEITRELR